VFEIEVIPHTVEEGRRKYNEAEEGTEWKGEIERERAYSVL